MSANELCKEEGRHHKQGEELGISVQPLEGFLIALQSFESSDFGPRRIRFLETLILVHTTR